MKIYLKNGKEIKIGDKILYVKALLNPFTGETAFIDQEIPVNELTIPSLEENGIIKVIFEKKPTNTESTTMNVDYFIKKISDRMGWNINKTYNVLNLVGSIYPSAVVSIILREIAMEMDHKYEGPIHSSPTIYSISYLSGKIIQINKGRVKNYRNFAAFRTIEDAEEAYKIIKPFLKEMFKSEYKK